ncbi:MAG: GGDEF domain-containing protein [Gammaproteobacteria bacterium]|nr:GGDEF domain-containing protein [Gammaproteobacteria bacterium]
MLNSTRSSDAAAQSSQAAMTPLTLLPHNIYRRIIYQLSLEDIEIRRKIILIYLFSSIGFGFLFVFGISALLNDRNTIATATLTASAVTLINFILLLATSNHARASYGVSLIIISVSLFLVINGGVSNTGLLWTYSAIPLVLFLHGHTRGTALLVLFLLASALIMYIPNDMYAHANYPTALKIRYIASYIALLLMTLVYEYIAHQTYERWRKLSDLFAAQARTDVLTGISNRRDIVEKINYENVRAKRRGEQYSILLIDIDHFKKINDQYGHDAGDVTLITVANTISNALFQRDLIGRWGGEEFLVILPDTNPDNAAQAADKIRTIVSETVIEYADQQITATISIGLATSDENYTPDIYIKVADNCLYNAKARGRNRVSSIFLAD